jgi:AAA family ATP:ADP antiporter
VIQTVEPQPQPDPSSLKRLAPLAPGEGAALGWSFGYFFFLLSGYYVLRPLRDEMGIAGGIERLPWVFTATFVAMLAAVPLYGWVAGRFARRRFVPLVYLFFLANILLFYALFQHEPWRAWTARALFVWVSVFNLFVVSVFWSFMVDIFRPEQGKRLFGLIAAGGSLGAVAGPLATAQLAVPLGPVNLLLVSAALLAGALVCIVRLDRWAVANPPAAGGAEPGRALGGSVWAGVRLTLGSRYLLGIAAFIWLLTTLSTFVYFEQARIVAGYGGPAERTALFARIDLAVNLLTILTQTLVTARLLTRLGVGATLAAMPLLSVAGFAALAAAPGVAVLVGFQVLRRAGDYALTRPARELLFAVLDRESKYKAKGFIDTVVFRGGDALAGWLFAGLGALGLGLAAIALSAVPVALTWWALALWLGRRQRALSGDGGKDLYDHLTRRRRDAEETR